MEFDPFIPSFHSTPQGGGGGTSGEETDPQRVAREITAKLSWDVWNLDFDVDQNDIRSAGNTLKALTPQDRTTVLSLLEDDKAKELAQGLRGLRDPQYRALAGQITERYSTVMGIELEAPPEKKAVTAQVIRTMFRHRPSLARKLASENLRLVIGPGSLSLRLLPDLDNGKDDNLGRYEPGFWSDVAAVRGNARVETVVHELAHAVHAVLSRSERRVITTAYRRAMSRDLASGYGEKNEKEFFADAVESWLTGSQAGKGTIYGPDAKSKEPPSDLLKRHHPALAALLERLFGPPNSVTMSY